MEPKFTLNRPKVSDDEINSKKDFDSLVKQFKEQSIEKARKDLRVSKKKQLTYAAVIAGVTVICTVSYLTLFNKQKNNLNTANDQITTSTSTPTNTPKAKTAFIAPPSKKINVPHSSYKVNNSKGGELTHTTASKIKIPKNAFVNKQGEAIVGEVEIKYREFHDRADIISSGIPMTYDSAGTQYHFESAGMFDIAGYQNGQPVYIAPGKDLEVELASQQAEDHFNQYKLDTVVKRWDCMKHDSPICEKTAPAKAVSNGNEQQSDKVSAIQKKIETAPKRIDSVATVYNKKIEKLPKAKEPIKPLKANASRPQFELEVDYKDFPELAAFKNATFEVGTENKNYRKELSQITWNYATISEGPDKGKNYLLTLKKVNQSEQLVVYPVLKGEDYECVLKTYEKKLADYNELVARRDAEEKRLKDEMETKQKVFAEEQKKLSEEMLRAEVRRRQEMQSQFNEESANVGNEVKVRRIFKISSFGIYNSDCPRSMPAGPSVNANFALAGNVAPVRAETIYLIEHEGNRLYTILGSRFSYDPSKEYSICVLSEGMMFYCSKEEFGKTIVKKEKRFYVKELDSGLNSVADLKKALEI
jgi:hypothetical protein